MIGSDTASLTVAELERLLHAVDPAVLLMPPRLLRRVIKQHCNVLSLGLQVPHRKSYVIGREALLRIVARHELGLESDQDLPATLLLIDRPEPRKLAGMMRELALLKYWRILFHARVHRALEERPDTADLRARIRGLGQAEFAEIRRVLEQEEFLLPPQDDATVYVEFAALYLELRHFAAPLLPHYFPGVGPFEAIDALLAKDLDAAGLFAATRLEGAPLPVFAEDLGEDRSDEEALPPPGIPAGEEASYGRFGRLIRRAKRASRSGNVVRAAILRTKAAAVAPPQKKTEALAGARTDLDRLATRLQAALELDKRDTARWRSGLAALLEPAACGIWSVENRLLYDLQKLCVDHERDIYVVDLVEWGLSLGRRPLKRPVPRLQEILTLKHLRIANRRLRSARVTDKQRQRLFFLLQSALHHAEERLRQRVRPILRNTLEAVGMQPANLPERVALDKLVEELLDRISARGFLNLGDLRDAVSRNQIKFSDLTGPREFLTGDQLLRADQRLACELDGVYHRGESYLRGLQRFSSLSFGTHLGRFLTRYLALPFGGAYATIVFVEEMLHLAGIHRHQTAHGADKAALLTRTETGFGVLALGLFYLLLLYWPAFRARIVQGLRWTWRGVRGLLFDLPDWVFRRPLVRRLLDSRPVRFFRRYLFRPLLATGLAAEVCRQSEASATITSLVSGGTFLFAGVLFNSRLGRLAEEALVDSLNRNWRWLRGDVLPGLFRFTLFFFKHATESLERLLYSVDEWLRFRKGDSRLSLGVKLVLGLVWFFLTYFIRVFINLFVEPTVNPIKHFPAVTVAAKLLLPACVPATMLHGQLKGGPIALLLTPYLGLATANSIAGLALLILPGLAGFLVWEFKENWKLYQATRPPTLRPVLIGEHGETMLRFLRPGLHSGTLPKLYARLRRAERRACRSGNWKAARRYRETLRHVEEEIRHFIEREFIELLNASRRWGPVQVTVGEIHLGTNRIRIELCCPELEPPTPQHEGEAHPEREPTGVALVLEEHGGWLVASIGEPAWLGQLSAEQRQAFTDALAGLYKMAGVDLVREQVRRCLGPLAESSMIVDQGLVVRPASGREEAGLYDFDSGPVLQPRTPAGTPATGLATVAADQLMFRQVPITWQAWVEAWEQDQKEAAAPDPLPEQVRLLLS